MHNTLSYFSQLIKRLGIVLFLLIICRVLFYLFNLKYFSELSFSELSSAFLYGFLFDISAIIMVNCLFIVLSLIPYSNTYFKKTVNWIFYLCNGLALAANCLDLVYFHFTFKRSTIDVFDFLTMGEDLKQLLPIFVKQYWYIFLIFFALIYIMVWLYKKTGRVNYQIRAKEAHVYLILSIVLCGIFILGYRGGFQLKPITIITASKYASVKNIPLVLNTPFTIVKSAEQKEIVPVNYFSEQELNKIYDPVHKPYGTEMKKDNVVVIILESFSFEYVGALTGKKIYTPFLDSLIKESFILKNAYANCKRSIEALPAIFAGLPTLMDEPYITSAYGSNNITSLANLLKKEGYSTSFFHGATNGTMSFDSFTKYAGFDKYYGRKEYNNDKDFDGSWGIWDEEYLQYFANEINKMKKPFLTSIFTLSSHHPFKLPEKYENKFPEGELEIHKTIAYTDHSLKLFFEKIKNAPWYKNTLFVITADHTGISEDKFYTNKIGSFKIPILFFHPSDSLKGEFKNIAQQADIMSSVLDYLQYDKKHFSFGNSVFDTTARRSTVNFSNNVYQLLSDSFALEFDGKKTIGFYNYKKDSLLKNNIPSNLPLKTELENYLKAYIQHYHNALINNKMLAE